MSAVTIHTPGFQLPRRPSKVIPFRGPRSAALLPPAQRRPTVSAPVAAMPLRLTRRGRLAITVLMAVVLVAVGLLGVRTALAGTSSEPLPTQHVTVLPGDTLWSIASEADASGDVRDRIAQIRDLNDLRTSQVLIGQELVVPVG